MTPGTYRITTLTGSVYEFIRYPQPLGEDRAIGTLRRMPARVPAADGGAPSAPMRRDGQALRVFAVRWLTVGQRAEFTIEPLGLGPWTDRSISTIRAIEQVA